MSRKTTLEEIAKAAGVSLSTVDRVVNRRGGVSQKAEARVLKWASQLNLDRRIFRSHLPTLRIAVLMQSRENDFFASLRDAFAELEHAGGSTRISFLLHPMDPLDVPGTVARIDELAASYDGLVITCPDRPPLAEAVKRAASRIPVVTVVTDLPQSGRLAYVGPDNRQMGRVAGELMGRFIGPSGGEVLVIVGMHHMIGHQEREMGFRSILRERFANCHLLEIVESEEDPERAASLTEEALRRHPGIRGIYNVSAGNFPISQNVERLGRKGEIVIITHELTARRRMLLTEGRIDAVIDQNPRLEARKCLDVLASHFGRDETISFSSTATPFQIILRENCPLVAAD